MNQINFLEKPKISFLSLKYLKLPHKKLSFNNCVFATCKQSPQKKQISPQLRAQLATTKQRQNQINKLALINHVAHHLKTNHYIYNHQVDKKDLAKKNCFWNQCFDKSRLKNFVLWFLLNHGEYKTVELVEQLKNLGFNYATKAGISLGIDDLKIPPKKADLMIEAEKLTFLTVNEYKRGEITGVERFQRLIDTWHHTSERLKQEVIDYFEATDILNPVYMMAFSGARGNISQVRQLVGMRGLMANPQGQIIDFPIRSNFREGLTLTEYIISSYGARKGIVDTALRTANAGYLTRRLVDVAQHVIISNFDCKTSRGIFLTDMKEGNKTIYSLQNRLVGRVLAKNIYSSALRLNSKKNINNKKEGNNVSQGNDSEITKDSPRIISSAFLVAKRNTEISLDLAFEISKVSKKVFVRSSLTCQTKKLVCQLCYGWSLAQGNLVSIGEAVGVVAAQSIGEPGTQLTMRTFHTGGVFSGDVTDQIKSPFDGFVEYLEPIAGELIRTPEGRIAFLTKNEGSFVLKQINSSINDETTQTKKYKIPSYTLIFKRMGEHVVEREVIAQISSISRQKNATDDAELTIKSDIEGQFYGKFLQLQENKIGPKLKEKERKLLKLYETLKMTTKSNLSKKNNNFYLSYFNSVINKFPLDKIYEAWDWGYAWILAGKIYQLSFPSSFFPIFGDFVNRKTIMNQTKWRFHVESTATFLELNPCLTFPTKKKQLNFIKKKRTLKNKHLVSSFFKIKNNSASTNKISKKNISQTQCQLIQNQGQINYAICTTSGKTIVNLNKKIISENKSLDNSINFPIIKNSVLSFDIQKIFYKKVGYLMSFNKGIDPFSILNKSVTGPIRHKTKRLKSQIFLDLIGCFLSVQSYKKQQQGLKNIEINQNKPFKQLSNLSRDDGLVLLSSLNKNKWSGNNDTKNLSFLNLKNLKNQNKLLKRSNFQEFNNLNGSVVRLNNKSTSFSTSNWLPNKKFLLNWYPKNSQLQTSGLFFIEQNNFTKINSFWVADQKPEQKKNTGFFVKTDCVTTDPLKINVSSKKINNPLLLKKESIIKGTNLKKVSFDCCAEKKFKDKSKIVTLPYVKNTFNDFKFINLKSNNFIDTLSIIKEKKYKLNLKCSVNAINSFILNDFKLAFIKKRLFRKKNFIKTKNLSKLSYDLNEHFKDSFCSGELSSFLIRKELLNKISKQQIKKRSNNILIKKIPFLKKPLKQNSTSVFIGTLYNDAFEKNKAYLVQNKLKKKANLEILRKTTAEVAKSQVLIYHLNKEQKLNSIHFGMRWKNPYNYKNIHFKNFLTKLYPNSKNLKIKQNICLANKANLFYKEDLNIQNQFTKQFNRKDKKKVGNNRILTVKKPNGIDSKYKIDSIHALCQQNCVAHHKKLTTRVFFTPEIFCQINSTFSVILNQSHFINSEINPPLFYLINRQGLVKFFYIFQSEKEKSQKNLINFFYQPINNWMHLKSFFIQKIRLNNINDIMSQPINLEEKYTLKELSFLNTKKTSCGIAICVTNLTKKNIVHLSNNPSKQMILSCVTNPFKKKENLKIKKKLVSLLKMVWLLRISKTNKNLQGFFCLANQEDKIKRLKLAKKSVLLCKLINASPFNQCYNFNQTINFNFLINTLNLNKQKKIKTCCKAKQAVCIAKPADQTFLNKTLSIGKPFKFYIYSINKENIGSILVYFSRFLFCYASFYNSSCLNLKAFSKKIIYMLIIKNKFYSNSKKKLSSAIFKQSLKTLVLMEKTKEKNKISLKNKLRSIFNISILRQNKKDKTYNKNILSPFIKVEIKKNSIIRSCTIKKWCALSTTQLIVSKKSNFLNNNFIKNKNLCSNKDICQISENPRIQIKKLNSILSKFFFETEKSIAQIGNLKKNLNLNLFLQKAKKKMGCSAKKDHQKIEQLCRGFFNKLNKKTNIKKLNEQNCVAHQQNRSLHRVRTKIFSTSKHRTSPSLIQKNIIEKNKIYASLIDDLNFVPKLYDLKNKKNIGFQVKFGWVYISKNLCFTPQKYLSLNKKFILPGKTLLDDLIFDNNSSYLEYIFLKKNQTKTNPSRKINIFAFKKLKSLDTWKWVSNKQSRFIPSVEFIDLFDRFYMQTPTQKFCTENICSANHKKNWFNNFSFGVLIRNVNEYKQSSLQDYKNEIYNFSNIKNKLIQYSVGYYAAKKKQQLLNKKLFNEKLRYYFLQRGLTNHLIFKVRKGLMNVNQSILNNKSYRQLLDLSFSLLIKKKKILKKSKNALSFTTELNSLKLLTILKKIAQLSSSLFNKPNKKKLISKKYFINKSYSSMAYLNLQFKKSLINKQKITLQTISTFPNIDLNISSNFRLYYLNKRLVYKTIFNVDAKKLTVKAKNLDPISFRKTINNFNKQISTSNQNKTKKNFDLIPQSHLNLKTNGISLPLFCRKPINFGSFLVSYKQPYGLNRTFNTNFSFFNYKNNLTFSLQKLNNSSYLSQFLEKYVLKLLVCQIKTYNLQTKVQYQINSSSNNNPSLNKLSNSFKNGFESICITNQTLDFFYFSEFFKISPLPLIASLEIISFLPIIFNCPYFSYNLIEKLERTLMSVDNWFNKSSNLFSEKHITKLNLLSKKISLAPQIKTQFFSSFENKFSLSEPIAKTSTYSSFEGELIYKKDLNSFLYKKKKRSFITEKLFPIETQNAALILTRQDLISFSLNPNKKLPSKKNQYLKQTFPTQNFFVSNSKTAPLRELINQSQRKEKYYLNDIIIKFQKINQLSNSLKDSSPTDSQKTNNLKEVQINPSFIPTIVKVSKLAVGLPFLFNKLSLGEFFMYGDRIKNNLAVFNTGQIIHINQEKLTLRKGQPIFISPKAIFHKYNGDLIDPKSSVITLAYSQLKTGDIIQGIPKVEQFFEARTTKRGRLFRDSLPNLLKALFKRYVFKLPFEKAVRQSFYKIQQIIVDGVQRVYRSQGVSIADKHLEIIVKQMTSKVRISFAGVTGFFPGEVVDLDLVEHVNTYVTRKVQYEPLVLGITKSSLEVNSFLSAASFQQTTRVLSKAALTRKRDFLRGLKENVILGNLIPAGTGLLVYLEKKKMIDSIVEDAFEEKKRSRRSFLVLHPRFKSLKHRTFLFKSSLFKRHAKLYTVVKLLKQDYKSYFNYKYQYKHNLS